MGTVRKLGGASRGRLTKWRNVPRGTFCYRGAAFDGAAAQQAGDLMASRHKKGRPGELRDTMIAGIVRAQHATLATRNTACFDDIPVTLIDPWTA